MMRVFAVHANNIDSWQSSVQALKNNQKHRVWQPVLSPPPLLNDVAVVLVAPKRPVSIGTVARALSCFEVFGTDALRIVQPRCEILTRASRNSSKGAQYMLHNARVYDSLDEALEDCRLSAAFARWMPQQKGYCDNDTVSSTVGSTTSTARQQRELLQLHGVPALLHHFAAHQREHGTTAADKDAGKDADKSGTCSLALVFGREEAGLTYEEVHACDCSVSISIGRLQESLSLSHAVSIALSQLYQQRLDQAAYASSSSLPVLDASGVAYAPASIAQLAPGWREQGKER